MAEVRDPLSPDRIFSWVGLSVRMRRRTAATLIEIKTAPADFRFPTTNQTRHCFTRYIEYHRCVNAKGEATVDCEKFAKYYRSLCPAEWAKSCKVKKRRSLDHRENCSKDHAVAGEGTWRTKRFRGVDESSGRIEPLLDQHDASQQRAVGLGVASSNELTSSLTMDEDIIIISQEPPGEPAGTTAMAWRVQELFGLAIAS
ncbi:hypothetical protein E2562_010999 [Oryza meyeriana var. granulata]|uniref:Cytochrome c oxidase subunit 6b n=1 Tax=Oryza meyeriana var. granulata TaxID=110450 RepID=A0A6G1BV15_9ORYZ|nr:hypothetical protein E2562_010999 [Oryza meyeriana var. granulata]